MKHLAKIIIALSLIASFSTTQAKKAPIYQETTNNQTSTIDLKKQVDEMNKAFTSMPENEEMKMRAWLDDSDENKPTIIMETKMLKVARNSEIARAMKTANVREVVEQQMQQLCVDPQMKPLIEKNVSYKIISVDKDGGKLNTIVMDLGKCK